jgi:hypothetical protein
MFNSRLIRPLACLSVMTGLLTACGGGSAAAPANISVAFGNAPPASLALDASASVSAVVQNDGSDAGVTWTMKCAASHCGTLAPLSTASGGLTTYTPPAQIPSPATVTLTATSSTDPSKSVSGTINLAPAPAPVLADGTYVFHIAGADDNGLVFVAGAFVVKGGVITAGEQDFGDAADGYTDTLVPSGCSLSVASGNIQVVLATGDSNVGVNGVETLRGAEVSASRALLSQFDGSAVASGSIDLQTSTAPPAGGYAFTLAGEDNGVPVSELAIGGVLNFSGSTLTVASSVFDFNDGGSVGQAQTFVSGSISTPDSFGRVIVTLTPSSASTVPEFALAGYIVGANRIELVESQSDALGADLGGAALGQGSNTGTFSAASVANTTYVYASQGQDSNGALTLAGGFAFNSDGSVSGDLAWNDLANSGGNQITAGTYSVDATGRVTLRGVVPQPLNVNLTLQLYLDGNGNALVLGADGLETSAGPAFLQTASGAVFSGRYALSAQGYANAPGVPWWAAVGPLNIDTTGSIAGNVDYSLQGAASQPAAALTGSEDPTRGVLHLTGLNASSPQTQAGFGYYPIDSRRVLAIEVDGQQLGLLLLEGVTTN